MLSGACGPIWIYNNNIKSIGNGMLYSKPVRAGSEGGAAAVSRSEQATIQATIVRSYATGKIGESKSDGYKCGTRP